MPLSIAPKKISCLFSILWCPSAFGRLLLCLSYHPLKKQGAWHASIHSIKKKSRVSSLSFGDLVLSVASFYVFPITRLKNGGLTCLYPLHQKKSRVSSLSFGVLMLSVASFYVFPITRLKNGGLACLYPFHQKKISCLFSILW